MFHTRMKPEKNVDINELTLKFLEDSRLGIFYLGLNGQTLFFSYVFTFLYGHPSLEHMTVFM